MSNPGIRGDMNPFNGVESAPRKSDPQVILSGLLKRGGRSDVIVFTLPLALLELTCIVTIPEPGSTVVPVYVKFRVRGT